MGRLCSCNIVGSVGSWGGSGMGEQAGGRAGNVVVTLWEAWETGVGRGCVSKLLGGHRGKRGKLGWVGDGGASW